MPSHGFLSVPKQCFLKGVIVWVLFGPWILRRHSWRCWIYNTLGDVTNIDNICTCVKFVLGWKSFVGRRFWTLGCIRVSPGNQMVAPRTYTLHPWLEMREPALEAVAHMDLHMGMDPNHLLSNQSICWNFVTCMQPSWRHKHISMMNSFSQTILTVCMICITSPGVQSWGLTVPLFTMLSNPSCGCIL